MRVDLEDFIKMVEFRKRINSVPLNEIELYQNGNRIFFDEKDVDEFRFTGLNNTNYLDEYL